MRDLAYVRGWLRERFPRHPYIYAGLSGATLLMEALKAQSRSVAVMPAFLCPNIPLAALRAGKRVVHADTEPGALHPGAARLAACLAGEDARDTALVVDHSFGYPLAGLDGLRRRFPGLLIVEDCVRALGVEIEGAFPGEHSDWVLLSMYKTIRGSNNGAILLARAPLPLEDGRQARTTLRERAATFPPLRFAYDAMERTRPNFGPPRKGLPAPVWTPAYGLPGELSVARFAAELEEFEQRAKKRRAAAGELGEALSRMGGIECMEAAAGCRAAGHFVSFRMPPEIRDTVLTRLHRKGLFLSRTWDLLPADYACFGGTFPSGSENSGRLASGIAHIPVRLFQQAGERRRLVEALRCIRTRDSAKRRGGLLNFDH